MKFRGRGALKYSNQEALAEIARVLRLPNAKLTTRFFEQSSWMSLRVCLRRFGNWCKALKATAETVDPQRDAELLARIRAYTAKHGETSPAAEPTAGDTPPVPQPAATADLE
jgi:hypothetical protein